jgi:hypothetical protein
LWLACDRHPRAEGRTHLGRDPEWVAKAEEMRAQCAEIDRQVLAAGKALGPLPRAVQTAQDALLPLLAENERWAVLLRCRRALVGGG